MKKALVFFTIFCGYITVNFAGTNFTDVAKFADLKKSQELLTTEDAFTNAWSKFDIESRLGKVGGNKADLISYISSQAREWKEDEIRLIKSIVKTIDNLIKKQGFKIEFPTEIFFVKTTAKEEGGALGYTRATYIVLSENITQVEKDELKDVIIHELFHVLSRNNPEFRKAMYKLIGFTIVEEVTYPSNIKDLRITNPDTPLNDCYITVEKDGKKVDCMMILYSSRTYSIGSFFEYLNLGFLAVKGSGKKEIIYEDGKPVIYEMNEVGNFLEQVGKNTGYVIHPEEALADNFALAINGKTEQPSQWLITAIQKKLKE